MKLNQSTFSLKMSTFLSLCITLLISTVSFAQITVYQYRRVPDDKIEEFIKRETTYWSKVAQKAVDNNTLTFWALLEKIGGYDLPNSSNFLFINTYPNIDSIGYVWGDAEAAAGVKNSEMETNSMSTTTSMFFLKDQDWAQSASAKPETDFNFVHFIYHNTDYSDSLIGLEKKYWKPFIQSSMDKKYTKQVAWGNASVLSPFGDNIKFTTVSYDLYASATDALLQNWDPKTIFPAKGLGMISKIEIGRRSTALYRVVKVVTK